VITGDDDSRALRIIALSVAIVQLIVAGFELLLQRPTRDPAAELGDRCCDAPSYYSPNHRATETEHPSYLRRDWSCRVARYYGYFSGHVPADVVDHDSAHTQSPQPGGLMLLGAVVHLSQEPFRE